MFAGLQSHVISFVCSKDVLLEWGKYLYGERGVETGEQLPPGKCVKKASITRTTLKYFSTLDLTQIF